MARHVEQVIVAVPAACEVGRRVDHGGAATHAQALEAGSGLVACAVSLLVGEVAQLVIRRKDRVVGRERAHRPVGENGLDLAAERVVEIFPAAASVADDHAAVEHVAGQPLPHLVAEVEAVVPGEEQGRQLPRVEREVLEVGLGLAVVDAQLLVGPGKQACQVGRIGHPVAVLNSLIALADEANRPQRHLTDQGGESGRPLLPGPPQGRGGQGQGGNDSPPVRLCGFALGGGPQSTGPDPSWANPSPGKASIPEPAAPAAVQ